MSLDELIEFEKRADDFAGKLVFWGLPVAAALTGLYCVIDQLLHGSLDGSPPRFPEGEAVAYRMSYLVPLLVRCRADVTPSSEECYQLFGRADPTGASGRELLSYAHFCELVPQARKGHFKVTRRQGGFDLTHPSQAFADAEVKDILLCELSLGFEVNPPPRVDVRCGILSGGIDVDDGWRQAHQATVHADVLADLYEHAYRDLVEPPILTDEGFRAAVGAGLEEFLRFRSAMTAIARFCQEICSWYRAPLQCGNRNNYLSDMYGQWLSICWNDELFFHHVRQMAGLSPEQTERLLSIYAIDLRTGTPNVDHARDGFFPPVWRLPGCVLFSPEVLGRFVSSRNLAFVLNWLEENRFNEVISEHLEPQLMKTATDLLAPVGGLECRPGRIWSSGKKKGEIDLLVYFPAQNVVWLVQAKGAIPPQGARMVQRLEDRVKEALRQLKLFRDLPTAERERILADGLGRSVPGVRVVDVVLLRACAGTAKVWSEKGDAVYLTLPLLAELTRQARAEGSPAVLVDCAGSVDKFLQGFIQSVNPHWETGSITVAGEELTMPLLKFDADEVERMRRQMWEGTSAGGRGNPWKVVAPPGSNVVVVPAESAPRRPEDQAMQIIRALQLMDHNPDGEDEKFAEAVGLDARHLRDHSVTGPALRFLDRYKAEKKRREK